MTEAIIFDCFGVLTTDGWLPFKRQYFPEGSAKYQQATDLNKSVDAGLTGYNDFIQGVADLAGVPETTARTQIEDNVANVSLFDYIRSELKPHYKIGLLSNAGENWLEALFGEERLKLFDAVSLSCETGFVKPDDRAYQDIADKLSVAPDQCIFVDDQDRYCMAAEDSGMHAIVFSSFPQLRAELSKSVNPPQ